MLLRTLSLATTMVLLASVALMTHSSPAHACGGFFCNGETLTPIFQSGERILFVQRDDGLVTMHIEVSYEGEPTEFAWLIPVLGDPLDADGNALPLDKAIGLSLEGAFNTLQSATNPTWSGLNGSDFPTECVPPQGRATSSSSGFGCMADPTPHPTASMDATVSSDSSNSPPSEEPVYVEDTAKVGPYDAQLIAAPQSSDDLFDWLNANGYFQDPASKPLLAHYVSQGFKFIGIRLQSGKDNGDIKPIRITLPEGGPCVPLRLTGIAATTAMPMRIWVLGSARAVPKNFLQVVVNEQAIVYPGGVNYDDVVIDAVREAGGRAFVTEMSGSTEPLRRMFLTGSILGESQLTSLADVSNTGDFRIRWTQLGLPVNATVNELLGGPEQNALVIDPVVVQRLIDEVARPAIELEKSFRDTKKITRFYSRIDPMDMTRDPVFGFNADLPDVSADRTMTVRRWQDAACGTHWILEWDDGRRYTLDNRLLGGGSFVPDAPALLRAEIADEKGAILPLHPTDVLAMDAVMDQVTLGVPTLTESQQAQLSAVEQTTEWPNPPAGFYEATGEGPPTPPSDEPADSGESCEVSGQGVMAGYLLVTLCFLLLWRRRRRGATV